MKQIPVLKLQEIANMLHTIPNEAKKIQISGWLENVQRTPDDCQFSELLAMSDASPIKDFVRNWVSNITDVAPEFTTPVFIHNIFFVKINKKNFGN